MVYAALVALALGGAAGRRARARSEAAGRRRGLARHARRRSRAGSPSTRCAACACPTRRVRASRRARCARTGRRWSALVAPLVGARLRLALHVGAAMLVLGAVAGMYVRGLTFEYRATWESTFVGPGDGGGPAARRSSGRRPHCSARRCPTRPQLAAMRAPGDAPAAIWIHLWAVTAALVVLLPRGVLAALAFAKQRRLARTLDGRPAGRLVPRPARTRSRRRPHRGRAAVQLRRRRPARRDTLRELLHDVFGLRADVQHPCRAAVRRRPRAGRRTRRTRWWSTASCSRPSARCTGASRASWSRARPTARACSRWWTARRGTRASARTTRRRAGERRRAWDRVLTEVGLAPLHVNLAAPLETGVVEQAEELLGARARSSAERWRRSRSA